MSYVEEDTRAALVDNTGSISDPSAAPTQQSEDERKTRLLIISFVLMLFFGLGNKITQVVQVSAIENYPVFLSLLTTFVYIPASFAYILPMIKWGSMITPEQRAIPQWTFFKIGALDSIAGIIIVLSITRIQNGTLIVLISQTAIPISLVISRFFLGSKYKIYHYVGCAIVFAGLLVVLIPRFLSPKDDDDEGNPNSPLVIGIAIIAMVLANIPMCLSTVVKELTLGDSDVDPVYLNGWVALWQFLVGIPLILPGALASDVAIKDIPTNLINGAKCYIGINSITKETTDASMAALSIMYMASQYGPAAAHKLSNLLVDTNRAGSYTSSDDILRTAGVITQTDTKTVDGHHTPLAMNGTDVYDLHNVTPFEADLASTHFGSNGSYLTALKASGVGDKKKVYDKCEKAPLYVNLYMAFNIVYNVLIIMMIKFGGANLFWVAMTVMVPLASIVFSLKFIPNNEPLRIWDIIGLVVLFSGLIVYRFYDQIRKRLCGYTLEDLTEEQQQEHLLNQQDSGDYSDFTTPIDVNPQLGGGINAEFNVNDDTYDGEGLTSSSYGRATSFPRGDSYLEAEFAPTITDSSVRSENTNHGRKKVKKRRN